MILRDESFLLGSGTGKHGGGRVWLQANVMGIRGHILANGEDGDSFGAGGSGGTIIMKAKNITIDRTFLLFFLLLEDALISAIGGLGNPICLAPSDRNCRQFSDRNWRFGGGGGGRIFLRYENLECGNYDSIVVYGGPSNGGVRGLIGGAGTVTHFVIQDNSTIVYMMSQLIFRIHIFLWIIVISNLLLVLQLSFLLLRLQVSQFSVLLFFIPLILD